MIRVSDGDVVAVNLMYGVVVVVEQIWFILVHVLKRISDCEFGLGSNFLVI